MREPGCLAGLASVCALALCVVILIGCGSTAPLNSRAPQLKLATYAASDWQAAEVALTLHPTGDGWELMLTSHARQPAHTVLLQLELPAGIAVDQAELLTPPAELSLIVADHPGVLAAGLTMPSGAPLEPGPLLRARLIKAPVSLKAAAKVPTGQAGLVPDLTASEDGFGGWVLSWGYYNAGDYDQNSEANIADLTPLAGRLGQSTQDGERDGLDLVLDGDHNTEVNVSDLTPLGANFLSVVDAYRVYRADGPDPQTAASELVTEVAFSASTVPVDARRLFHTTLSGTELTANSYYFVRPLDSDSGQEGAASNTLQYLPSVALTFRVPPRGDQVVDTAQCQNPSLVLMPAIAGVSAAGAPVIVYSVIGGGGGATTLKLAYYGANGWVKREIGGGDNWGQAQARWLPDPAGSGPGSGVVIGYNVNALQVVERRFDELWEPTGGTDVGAGSGTLTRLSLDRDPVSGQLAAAHAYAGSGGEVQYSEFLFGGGWATEQVYAGETIGGLSFRFNPSGGAPWLLFTHGTLNTGAGLLSLSYSLEQGRRVSEHWQITPVPYPDSPLAVDLGFRADGTPQLVCTAARDFTVDFIPTVDPFTVSLMFDAVTGEYNGSAWSLARMFESSFGISLGSGFPPSTLVLTLNLATDVGWAQPDELLCSQSAGAVEVGITDFTPQDGALASSTTYYARQATGSYTAQAYYSGAAGRAYSWESDANADPVCAYVRTPTLAAEDVLNGDFDLAGQLAFWRP